MNLEHFLPVTQFIELATRYHNATNLPLIMCDTAGTRIYGTAPGSPSEQMGIIKELMPHDRKWLVHAVANSYQWGEAYFSTTPLGLVTFAVPLTYNNQLQGALISGFVLLPEMEDDFSIELQEHLHKLKIIVTPSIVRSVKIPSLDKIKMKDAAKTLFNMSIENRLNDLTEMQERQWRYRQQVHIAHYMEYMKTAVSDPAQIIINRQNEIFNRIRRRDFTGAREIMNEFLGAIFIMDATNVPILKVRILELAVIISRSAIDTGVDVHGLLKLNNHYLPLLLSSASFEALCTTIAQMLEEFIRLVASAKINKKNLTVKKMITFINEHFTQKITAAEVAQVAHLSMSRALHLFKEETGQSLSAHIRKCRIDYAKYLIAHTDNSLADIALDVGFFDQSHFSRQFRSQENTTPKAYQQALRKFTQKSKNTIK